jgi:uncharacterized repeat protein (TIGR03803 family)
LTTLYSFCTQSGCPNGSFPGWGELVQTISGDLYRTTEIGGYNCASCYGTAFKITPSGTLTTIYNFCSQSGCDNGSAPVGGLTPTENGDTYGTTSEGGSDHAGTLFSITPSGTLTTLYIFCSQSPLYCLDGGEPEQALAQATDGDFFGTTSVGGAGCPNSKGLCGTVFKITPSGTLTTLHSFCSQSACAIP